MMMDKAMQIEIEIKKTEHRDAQWWLLRCEEKEPFNSTVKKMEGRRWSATHSTWLIPVEKTEITGLISLFGESYRVEIEEDKDESVSENGREQQEEKQEGRTQGLAQEQQQRHTQQETRKAKIKEEAPTLSLKNKEAMELYKRQVVLKSYSPATLKTYSNEFRQFLETLKGVAGQRPDQSNKWVFPKREVEPGFWVFPPFWIELPNK